MIKLQRRRRRIGRTIVVRPCPFLAEALEGRLLLARDFHVDINSPGLGTAESWETAWVDLQQALGAAQDGDRILVADGTYRPTTNLDRSKYFQLKQGVQLIGGYAGYGATDPNARDPAVYQTILSGDIGLQRDRRDDSYHVVFSVDVDSRTVMDGVTVYGGQATGTDEGQNIGAGMYNHYSSPTLINCIFTENYAFYAGGAMYNIDSSPTMVNCTLRFSSARYYGGGMFNSYANPSLTDCTFLRNFVSGTRAIGGGMYNDTCAPSLTNCRFIQNTADTHGGGMSNWLASPIVTNCTFERNSVIGIDDDGGGMYNEAGTPVINGCTFNANYADNNGGGMCNFDASPVVTNCVFAANSAGASGGGMYNGSASPKLLNCTFTGNTARIFGGAIFDEFSAPTLTNCIVWANGSRPEVYDSGSTTTITYSDVYGWRGNGNVNVDPRFNRTPAPGADRRWGTADDDYGDLRLRVTSPVIDAGDNSAVPLEVTADLSGHPRFFDVDSIDDTGAGTAPIVDMGAYERPGDLALVGNAGDDNWRLTVAEDHITVILEGYGDDSQARSFAGISNLWLDTGSGNDTVTFDCTNGVIRAENIQFNGGPGTDRLIIEGNGFETIAATNVKVTFAGVPMVLSDVENQVYDLDAVNVQSGTQISLAFGGNKLLRLGSLIIGANGTLDLGDNDLIIRARDDASADDIERAVFDMLANARNKGPTVEQGARKLWTGTGLTSSIASQFGLQTLALMRNNGDDRKAEFAGESLLTPDGLIDENVILVTHTWNGDVNLSGTVDPDDYFVVDRGRIGKDDTYQTGDLNYDRKIDADDYFLIDQAYIGQRGILSAGAHSGKAPAAVKKTAARAKSHQQARQRPRSLRRLVRSAR